MIKEYLKAGYPALCLLTQEPQRAEEKLPCEGWRFFAWDCIQGIRDLENNKIIDEIRDPVEAVKWLNGYQDKCQNVPDARTGEAVNGLPVIPAYPET